MAAAASSALAGVRVSTDWEDCLQRIQARDERALSELYDHSSRAVYGLAMRITGNSADADEVVCDVYAQIWRTAGRFDRMRGTAISWILMLTRSRALDLLRSRGDRASREQGLDEAHEFSSPHANAEQSAILGQRKRLIEKALELLDEDQRSLIELAFFRGLSHAELSEQLGLPLGTVKTRIRLGMMKLRSRLESQRGAL